MQEGLSIEIPLSKTSPEIQSETATSKIGTGNDGLQDQFPAQKIRPMSPIIDRDDEKKLSQLVPLNSRNQITLDFTVPYSDLEKAFEKAPIGIGATGAVYQHYYKAEVVAVKRFLLEDFSAEKCQEIRREAAIMASIRSDYLIALRGICLEPPHYCLVMEFIPGGDLYQKLQTRVRPFSISQCYRLAADIASGLFRLHDQGILHRDLKSQNVLLTESGGKWRAKVSDFGLATLKRTLLHSREGMVGSLPWLAPEIVKGTDEYSKASDMYSLGLVLYELVTGKVPYYQLPGKPEKPSFEQIKEWISTGERLWPYLPKDCPIELAQLIRTCCAENPKDRPTIDMVVDQLEKLYIASQCPEEKRKQQQAQEMVTHEEENVYQQLSDQGLMSLVISDMKDSRSAHLDAMLQQGISINRVDEQGHSFLHCAIHAKQIDLVKILLAHHARIDLPDKKGITPLALAQSLGESGQTLVALLKKHSSAPAIPWVKPLPNFSHPDLALVDSCEQVLLEQFAVTLEKLSERQDPQLNFMDCQDAFQVIYSQLHRLSLPALYGFANLCYRYFAQQLPEADAVATATATLSQLKSQLQSIANQRRLYREVTERRGEKQVHYYWAGSALPTALPAKSGAFYLCFPSYELPPQQAQASLTGMEAIENPDLIALLTQQEHAERLLHQQRLVAHQINALSNAMQRQTPLRQQQISDYQSSVLLYQAGYIQPITTSFDAHLSATYYFFRLVREQQLAHWREQSPLVSTEFTQGVELLRDRMEQILLRQARMRIFNARWQRCERALTAQAQSQGPFQLQDFCRWQQEVFAIQTIYSEFKEPSRTALLDQLASQLNEGEYDDRYRMAIRTTLSTLCRLTPADSHWTLTHLTEAVLNAIHAWHQNGKTALALAQCRYYRKEVQSQFDTWMAKVSTFTDETVQLRAKNLLLALQQSLTACDSMLATIRRPAATPALIIPPDTQWQRRTQLFQDWRQHTQQQLEEKQPAQVIQTHNTTVAQRLMQDLCAETETQLGEPPCAFSILGLGSYSRGEISFCSDLDVVWLIADATAKGHPYFQSFLALLVYKTSGFPQSVLPLESKELCAMQSGECWLDTPTNLLAEHCYLPGDVKALGGLSDRSDPLRWPKPLYYSRYEVGAAEQLWQEYRQGLSHFFHQQDERGIPYYRQIEPWSLQQHLKKDVLSAWALRIDSDLNPPLGPIADEKTEAQEKEIKEIFDVKEAEQSVNPHQEPPTASLKIVSMKALLYPITQAVLSWGCYLGFTQLTETHALLDAIATTTFLPLPFLQRVRSALTDLHSWRLRQHWAWLQQHPTDVQLDEVFLWPPTAAQQERLNLLARGFYLSASETGRLAAIRTIVEMAIQRSIAAFLQLPLNTPIPPIPRSPPKQEKELKYPLPSKKTAATPVFNPLAAAVENVLWQVNTPPDAKADSSALACYQRQQQADIHWLAKVMALCADELPAVEPRQSDPRRVKRDPTFCQHWHMYWKIPLRWRSSYIQTLHQTIPFEKTWIVAALRTAPNQSGWRLSWQEEEVTWQKSLQSIILGEPQPGHIPASAQAAIRAGEAVWLQWVQGQSLVCAALKPDYIPSVFAGPNRWKVPEHKTGNHRIYSLDYKGTPLFWKKIYPEQPSTEYIISALVRRLGIQEDIPMSQLLALHHSPMPFPDGSEKGGQITQSAVWLSAPIIAEMDLQTVLEKKPQLLQKLDFLSFVRNLLRVLLTNPEDDKGNDYFLVKIPHSDRYQLVSIDNERAWFPASRLTTALLFKKEELLVKSILYCLDQMVQPWSSDSRIRELLEDLRQLQPAAVIRDLLNELNHLHYSWQQLFPEANVAQHARCQEPWLSLPVLMIPQGLENLLLKRLTALQTALRLYKCEEMTGLKLLEVTQPKLAIFYKQAFKKWPLKVSTPHIHVLTRFDKVAGEYYQKSKTKNYHASVLSGPQLLSRQLSLSLPELIKTDQDFTALEQFAKDVWNQRAHSVLQALEQTQHWQLVQAEQVKTGLLKMREEARIQLALLAAREQNILLDQLMQQELSSTQQEFLLTALVGAKCHQLNLTAFKAVLTDERLALILKTTEQPIVSLNISGCTGLTPGILKIISRYCPHLKRLRLNDQVTWDSLLIDDFADLVHLECNNAAQLKKIAFGRLPELRKLFLKNAGLLRALITDLFGSEACPMPKLQKLEWMAVFNYGRSE